MDVYIVMWRARALAGCSGREAVESRMTDTMVPGHADRRARAREEMRKNSVHEQPTW